jgi:hypothetical protein
MRTTRFLYPAAALVCCLAFGCEQAMPPLAPVRGRICYRSVPLHTGRIVFSPDSLHGTTGPLASAEIQPDGSFTLRTADAMGAAAGWYRITVLAVETAGARTPGDMAPRPRLLLPEKYADPALSGLAWEIKVGQENTVNLNLD